MEGLKAMHAAGNPKGRGGISGTKERMLRDLTDRIDTGLASVKPIQVRPSTKAAVGNGKEFDLMKRGKEKGA